MNLVDSESWRRTASLQNKPGVWTEADQQGVIQLHISSQTFVFTVQEVFGAPDPDGAVVGTGSQVLPIAAEIEARHFPIVALRSRMQTEDCRSTQAQVYSVKLKAAGGEGSRQIWKSYTILMVI